MINILFAVLSGIISGIGMGGGTVLIFLLTTFSGVSQHMAQGANLIFFIPTCIVSIFINLKNKNIDIKTAVVVIISGIIGAVIGSKLSLIIDAKNLKKYFGIFLLLITIYEIYSLIKSNIKSKKVNNKNIN
ncbi:MAG: sulfite exporter TauE/SafE family protein [Clostridia bacterium]|nr:sulfite exporter TauE/SafE family protein [Clostridia bacterium]